MLIIHKITPQSLYLENLLVQLKEVNNDMKNGKIDPDKVYLDYYKGSYLIQWSELTKNLRKVFFF